MDDTVIAYGLTKEQGSLLEAAMPQGYKVMRAECITDLIVTDAICSIVDAEQLDKDARNTLIGYYIDVGDWSDETVVWLGDVRLPKLPPFIRRDSFLDLVTELDSILKQARSRYDTMRMYSDAYMYLPNHVIEESMEADVYAALYRKYGTSLDKQIVKRTRREWQAVLEARAAEELAAVYELTRWLKRNGYSFQIECKAVFRFVLYLLDIVESASLPPADYDPLGQKERLKTGYVFCLPQCLKPQIEEWQKHHWLITKSGILQQATLKNIHFVFK